MENEELTYIPLETNDEFFDGFHGAYDEVMEAIFVILAIPSELYNRNGNSYPANALASILLTQPLMLRHEARMALPNLDFSDLVGDYPEFEDIAEDEEVFTKVNWKEEGF
jgi:hypothetical protein